jgi:predicted nucleic acid-binding protein
MGSSTVKLVDALRGVQRLAIETAPIIYFIEKHPSYLSIMREVLKLVEAGTIEGVTSTITVTEVLSHPIKMQNQQLVKSYRNILMNSKNLSTVPVNFSIAETAGHLRATYNLKTPDALHVATALFSGCDALITNDKTISRVTELTILILDDLELM